MQRKLTVNQPGDVYEQEADRMADMVMRMSDPPAGPTLPSISSLNSRSISRRCSCGLSPSAGECEECEAKGSLQRSAEAASASTEAPPIVHEVLRSPGQPLDRAARNFMEPRFGADFRDVRIHAGARAAEAARAVNSLAFTVGNNIVLSQDLHTSGEKSARRLIAHELVHVLQQDSTHEARRLLCAQPRAGANSPSSRTLTDVQKVSNHKSASQFLQRAEGPCPDIVTPHKLLMKGMIDPGVREVQRKLNLINAADKAVGHAGIKNAPLNEDCIFGPLTYGAVLDFQKQSFSDPKEHDGKVGDHTWAELDTFSGTPTPLPALPTPASRTDPLRRIANVNLTFGTKPHIKAHVSASGRILVITLDNDLQALGSADVVGVKDCDKYKFGFLQICRPFDVHRVTYHSPRLGADFDIDEGATVRKGEPILDVVNRGDTFITSEEASAQRARCARSVGRHGRNLKQAFVLWFDRPAAAFALHPRVTDDFFITGLAWQTFFFTAFSVQLPDGSFRHLQSFYWEIKYCETLGKPSPGSHFGPPAAISTQVNIHPPANGASDGDFLRLAGRPATRTCNDITKAATSLNVRGPGVSPIVCPIQ